MPVRCSICEQPETANVINELLEEKVYLDVIAERTGVHRSSIHRHKKKCFAAWRAAKLKAKKGKSGIPGRMIVSWPDGSLTDRESTISRSELAPNDALFVVEYAQTSVRKCGNPRALLFDSRTAESFFEAALAEDAERAS